MNGATNPRVFVGQDGLVPKDCDSKSRAGPRDSEPAAWKLHTLVAAIGFALFIIALSGFPNLMDNERRVASYVLDAVQNGHWAIQKDATGELASKPPLLTWLAALGTLAFGKINLAALYLPNALAAIGVALILVHTGKRHFGWTAGWLAGLTYLLCPVGAMQMRSVRYDGLLALPVTLGALAAYAAWSRQNRWVWFWLAAAAGTLVKGPIAVVLAGAGLLAHVWEKRTGKESVLRGSHFLGVLCYLMIVVGWLWSAYQQMGHPVIDKLLGRELIAHATGAGRNESMLLGFYVPPLSVLTGFAPWSLLAGVGLWRVWKEPHPDPEQRRFERFLFCWFLGGLLLFAIAAHQRSRLVQPLLPAAALLAGRELARLLRVWSSARLARAVAFSTALFLAAAILYHHLLMGYTADVQRTVAVRELARRVRAQLNGGAALVHVDSPFALQFYLNTDRPMVPAGRAAELLRGDLPAYVAVSNSEKFAAHLQPNPPVLYEIIPWPGPEKSAVRILSNRPLPPVIDQASALLGPLLLRLDGAELLRANLRELVIRPLRAPSSIQVKNESSVRQEARLRLMGSTSRGTTADTNLSLGSGEMWTYQQ